MLKRNNKGQALVEFAIIIPVLILILAAIMEFGLMLNAYLSVSASAREGARVGAVGGSDIQIDETIRNMADHLDQANMVILITPGQSARVRGDVVHVVVRYTYDMQLPIISNIIGASIPLESESFMRIE